MTLVEAAAAVLAQSDWLTLATIDDDGHPAASYLPYACVDGAFAIAASGLAAHARHLHERPRATVLFVGEHGPSDDSFARARLAVTVRARYCERSSPASQAIWNGLERRHGATVRALRDLPDFMTLRLEPHTGRAVLGFSAASDLDEAALREIVALASRSAERR